MEIDLYETNGVVVLKVVGRIDQVSAKELGKKMDSAVDVDTGKLNLALELEHVEYCSAMGLREMLRVLKHLKRNNGNMVIAHPSDRMSEALMLSGLNTVFDIYPIVDEAINSF